MSGNTTVRWVREPISSDAALRIARADAEHRYRDLTEFRITMVLKDDRWCIDFDQHALGEQGGGPRYVINALTGGIISKEYDR